MTGIPNSFDQPWNRQVLVLQDGPMVVMDSFTPGVDQDGWLALMAEVINAATEGVVGAAREAIERLSAALQPEADCSLRILCASTPSTLNPLYIVTRLSRAHDPKLNPN